MVQTSRPPVPRASRVSASCLRLVLSLALALSACTTTSTINTAPPGAKIHVADRYLGMSPVKVKMNDGYLDDTTYFAKISKEGYETQEFELTQRMRPGFIALDALLCLPTFGLGCYLIALNGKRHEKEYLIPLEPTSGAPGNSE